MYSIFFYKNKLYVAYLCFEKILNDSLEEKY